jgi:hypothetical protein
VLADILIKAKKEKEKRMEEEAEKMKRGDDIFEQNELEKKLVKGIEKRNKWILYPDDKFKQIWDLIMTV